MVIGAIGVASLLATTDAFGAAREHNYRDYAPGEGQGSAADTTPLEDQRIVVAIDAMLGFGSSTTGEPSANSLGKPITVLADHSVYAESFIGTLRVDVAKNWNLRASLPFTYMSFEATTGRRLGGAAAGNASLEADHRFFSSDAVDQWAILALFAPTAQGTPPPSGELGPEQENIVNTYFANQTALRVRGYEQLAPWAYDRWAIVPRYLVTSPPRRPGVTYEGSIALESLFDTSGDASAKYAARFSGWLRGGWAFDDVVDVALRVGYGIPLHGTGEDHPALAIEPQLRLVGPRLTALLGLLVPLSGGATDPRFTSIHAAVSARF